MTKEIKKAIKKTAQSKKTKEELKQQINNVAKVQHIKDTVRLIFPELNDVGTIYDGQTVVNALSGFISAHMEKKLSEIKLSDIEIDLSKEEDTPIKAAILKLADMFKDEPAKEISGTLERLGQTLEKYSSFTFMKKPMSDIKIEDILSK